VSRTRACYKPLAKISRGKGEKRKRFSNLSRELGRNNCDLLKTPSGGALSGKSWKNNQSSCERDSDIKSVKLIPLAVGIKKTCPAIRADTSEGSGWIGKGES